MRRRLILLAVVAVAGSAVGVSLTLLGSATAPGRHRGTAVIRGTSTATAPTPAGTSTTPGRAAAPAGPPYAVTSDTLTLVDSTRPSPRRGTAPGASSRTLRTIVRKPIGAPRPLPLVVFAPGFDSTPETYETLLDAWAAAGYLVAAPDFPGSASDLPGTPTEGDIPQQARDLSFVITALLGGRESAVDPTRIAVAGHSDGGSSVVMLAEDPSYADPRVGAYLVLAGQIPDGVPGPWDAAPPGALLCVVGSDDQYGNLSLTGTAYATARLTKAMITVPGGDHLQLFVGPGPVPDEVRAATVRFFALALGPHRPVTDAAMSADLAAPSGQPAYTIATG